MRTRNTKVFAWLIALGLILACVPSVTVPGADTPVPGAVNTFIAQTAEAAMTATARVLPSATPTETMTPTPRNTDTPTPTETPTVIFILSSPTPLVIPTFTQLSGSGSGGSSSSSFACRVDGQSPPNGSAFNPRADFDARWTVRNIGQRNWDRNSIDYVYLSGDQFHKVSGYDLPSNVPTGTSTDILVDMEAPRNAGTYTTRWTMRAGSDNFCTLSLTIVVR